MFVEWVTVAVRERLEALFIKSLLEGAGILVRLQGEALGEIYGFNTGPLGLVKVQVPKEVAGKAEAILNAEIEGSKD